jgi:tetratricopeptide (TPR) repeat protein
MSLNNLALRLSDLGRREDALARAEEAMALYRELAAARPDAFRPDLATSLSVLGDCLEAVDRLDEALAADEDAIATLWPAFERFPGALARRMMTYLHDYLRRCEKGGREPDMALLARLLALFQKLQPPDADPGQTEEGS